MRNCVKQAGRPIAKPCAFSKGARPEPGVNKAIAEWPTGKDETGKQGFADYVLFVGLKPIAVVEAKRKKYRRSRQAQ